MKLLRFILLLLHITVLALLLAMLLNSIVPPKIFPYFNLLSLGFPVLITVYLLLTVIWILFWKKRAVIFILFALLFIIPAKRWLNYSGKNKEKGNLKVLTFNTKNIYSKGKDSLTEYFKNIDADIIFAQESGFTEQSKPESNLPYSLKNYPLIAVYSKYNIINKGNVLPIGDSGNAFFADIDFNGKTIRLINVYLEPYFLNKSMVKPTDDYNANETKAKSLVKKLIPTFKIHQEQVDVIADFVKKSPHPVILAGDFNAVPNSFEYYRLKNDLTDVFQEKGNGLGTTFHDYKFPIRIDYIFSSKEIAPVDIWVDRNVKLSDHFPVFANFKIEPK